MIDTLSKEWSSLADVTREKTSWSPLEAAEIERLEARYTLPRAVRSLMLAGWPEQPIVVDGYDRVLWGVDELLKWKQDAPGWPSDWFPFTAIGDHYMLFARADEPGTSVWAIWNDGSSTGDGGALLPEGIVWSELEAFVRAIRLSYLWIKPEHFVREVEGRWPFKRETERLRGDVAESIRSACASTSNGPCLLPRVRDGIPEELDEPLYQRVAYSDRGPR